LNKILLEATEGTGSKTRFRLWKFHPDAEERLEALQHPEILFRSSPAILFLAGVLLSFLFAGIYFLFAAFLAFGGTILSLRASASGLSYWALTGIWWSGFVLLVLLIFGLTGWLINAVLLPQLQKQAILDLMNTQNGWAQYIKLGISSFLLITGIELGLYMTPFGQLAPNDLSGILIEFFIVIPGLTCLAWWYLAYMRFVTLRLSATQTGRKFSAWRSRFMTISSSVWIFLFFIPGVVLTRFLDGSFQGLFAYLSAGWLVFTLLFSPLIFAVSWVSIKAIFENRNKRCPHCGKSTRHSAPAVEFCEHCERILGEWLFIVEKSPD
jgi:hypothetical protein